MRLLLLPVALLYLLPDTAWAAEPCRVLVLGVCPDLPDSFVESVRGRLPDLPVTEQGTADPGACEVNICARDGRLVATVTDLRSGSSDSRSLDAPGDAGEEQQARLLGTMVREAIESLRAAATQRPDEATTPEPSATTAPEEDATVSLGLSLSGAAAGNIDSRSGYPGNSVGGSIGFLALFAENWTLELAVRPLAVLEIAQDGVTVNPTPLSLAVGYRHPVGPVVLGAAVEGVAEWYTISGGANAAGWRGGLGLAGTFAWPFWWAFELRVDLGVDFFPVAKGIQWNGVIIEELGGWRWNLGLGLAVRFDPV